MSECLGIYLGGEAAVLSVVSRQKTGLSVRYFDRRPYGEDILDARSRAAFAARLAVESGFCRLPTVLSLPGTEVFLRPLTVPFVRRSHIGRTLAFELEGLLLFDIEAAVIDFSIVATAGTSTKLLVAAMKAEALAEVTAPFEEAGIRLAGVTADVLSAGAMADVAGAADYALLDVSSSGLKISLCSGGRTLFARAAPAALAGGDVEAALASWYKQSVMAAPAGSIPSKVLVAGPGAAGLDLERFSKFAEVDGSAVAYAEDFAADVSAERVREMERYGIAAVNAAATFCLDSMEFDLLAAMRGRRGLLDTLFRPAVGALALLGIVFGLMGWEHYSQSAGMRSEIPALREAELALWSEIFPDRQPPGGSVNLGLKSALIEIRQSASGSSAGIRAADMLKALHVISTSAPPVKIDFAEFTARPGAVVVKASSTDSRAADALARAVTGQGAFRAESRNLQTDEGRWTFEIVMTPARTAHAQ